MFASWALRLAWSILGGNSFFLRPTWTRKRFKGTCYKAANWISLGPDIRLWQTRKNVCPSRDQKGDFRLCFNASFSKPNWLSAKTIRSLSSLMPIYPEKRRLFKWLYVMPIGIPAWLLRWIWAKKIYKSMADELTQFHQEFHACFGRMSNSNV